MATPTEVQTNEVIEPITWWTEGNRVFLKGKVDWREAQWIWEEANPGDKKQLLKWTDYEEKFGVHQLSSGEGFYTYALYQKNDKKPLLFREGASHEFFSHESQRTHEDPRPIGDYLHQRIHVLQDFIGHIQTLGNNDSIHS